MDFAEIQYQVNDTNLFLYLKENAESLNMPIAIGYNLISKDIENFPINLKT